MAGVEGPEGRDTFHVGSLSLGGIVITYSRDGDDVMAPPQCRIMMDH